MHTKIKLSNAFPMLLVLSNCFIIHRNSQLVRSLSCSRPVCLVSCGLAVLSTHYMTDQIKSRLLSTISHQLFDKGKQLQDKKSARYSNDIENQ